MDEDQALKYAANILRTLSAQQELNDAFLKAARALDEFSALHPHDWVCADNVPPAEKNHPEGYVYCSVCGTERTDENDGADNERALRSPDTVESASRIR